MDWLANNCYSCAKLSDDETKYNYECELENIISHSKLNKEIDYKLTQLITEKGKLCKCKNFVVSKNQQQISLLCSQKIYFSDCFICCLLISSGVLISSIYCKIFRRLLLPRHFHSLSISEVKRSNSSSSAPGGDFNNLLIALLLLALSFTLPVTQRC